MQHLISNNSSIFKKRRKEIQGISLLAGLLFTCTHVIASDFYGSSVQSQSQPVSSKQRVDEIDRADVIERVSPWSQPQNFSGQTNTNSDQGQPGVSSQRYYNDPEDFSCTAPMRAYRNDQGGNDRFVTPDILDRLKSQQMQYQVMPENRWKNSRSNANQRPGYGSGYGYGYGSAPGVPGSYNPVPGPGPYNAPPMVSPWSNSPDVLFRGEQFPMVPNEALGGFPPMHVSPYGMNFDGSDDTAPPPTEGADRVFNPFTFLPNYGSQ